GVKEFDVKNFAVSIAAPVEFNPEAHFSKKEMKGRSPLNAMAVAIAREAMKNAGLLGEDGKLQKDIDRRQAASWMASAFGSVHHIIDVYNQIHKKDEAGNENPRLNSGRISPRKGLEIFPEELNGQVAIDLGVSGWGGSSVEACATGLSNIIEAARIIKGGQAKVAVAGGLEDILSAYPEASIGMFAAMRSVLSTRNDEPEKASRPFDKDRDGFVLGAGGGAVVIEALDHALERGAPILAEILGFNKSMDGSDPTNLNKKIVAGTILKALYNQRTKEFYEVDSIFAHATSTNQGDQAEAELLKMIFGDSLKNIPIAAIKSNMGHLAGGAGAVNVIAAINALNSGKIPPILNLENPSQEFEGLFFVRGKPLEKDIKTALVLAYGFGGHNAVMLLGRY
ncbi:hypothetical protein CO010_03860, partial [Candidatus Shapirobacteria bacterium CG_4_8_14_3_um_filter_39_11]